MVIILLSMAPISAAAGIQKMISDYFSGKIANQRDFYKKNSDFPFQDLPFDYIELIFISLGLNIIIVK